MLKRLLSPFILIILILAGCQAPQGKFTPEQVAAMKSYGFTEASGDWSLGLSDTILFDKMTISCVLKVKNRSVKWQLNWRLPA